VIRFIGSSTIVGVLAVGVVSASNYHFSVVLLYFSTYSPPPPAIDVAIQRWTFSRLKESSAVHVGQRELSPMSRHGRS